MRTVKNVAAVLAVLAVLALLAVSARAQTLQLREAEAQSCYARLEAIAAAVLVTTSSGREDRPMEEYRQRVTDDLGEDIDGC